MLLNRKQVREYILKTVKENRPGWPCTRVSPSAMNLLEAKIEKMLYRAVWQHPSIGKTFKEII